MEPWRYRDRWGLVTGASAGLGRVFAEKLAARGMHLVLSARREERLAALAERLERDHGIRTAVVRADLSVADEPRRLWAAARAAGPIDLLVNNAGFGIKGPFDRVPLETHLAVLQVNCRALLELSHLALAEMRPRGTGAIINVSSITAFQPVPQFASYAASKAFVLSLTEALWAENRTAGLRILALCPGRTPTEFQALAGTGTAEGAFGHRTPEQVVESGLAALERGRSTRVPGLENAAAAWVVRALPRAVVLRGMRRIMEIFSRSSRGDS